MARKFTIAVFFALAMCVLMVPAASTTYASESPSTEYYNVQYGFSYEETVMPTNQIVRKYEKPETSLFSRSTTTNSTEKTKAILASLGMGEDFIDELSNEQLNEYANSKSITAMTSYIKTTPEGISTYVTKEDAENASRAYDPPAYDDVVDGGSSPTWVGTRIDEYMKLVLVVSYRGNAVYHISVDAAWLQAPTYYYIDTLGACAQDCSVVNNSRAGWYSYMQDDKRDDAGAYLVKRYFNSTVNDPNCDFHNAVNGSWYGTTAAFEFMASYDTIWVYDFSDYKAHAEFNIQMLYPSLEKNFSIVATYAHSTQELEIAPSFGISIPAGISIGLFNLEAGVQNRNVELPEPINYVPD